MIGPPRRSDELTEESTKLNSEDMGMETAYRSKQVGSTEGMTAGGVDAAERGEGGMSATEVTKGG